MHVACRASARLLVIGGLALGFLIPRGAAAQMSVTLDEAVERALVRSPQMAQQEQTVGNALESQRTAFGQFLPSLSANSGGSLRSQDRFDPTTDRIVSGSSDSYSAGLSASYTVFAGGRRFAEYGAANADVRAAEARRQEQRFLVTVQTKSSLRSLGRESSRQSRTSTSCVAAPFWERLRYRTRCVPASTG